MGQSRECDTIDDLVGVQRELFQMGKRTQVVSGDDSVAREIETGQCGEMCQCVPRKHLVGRETDGREGSETAQGRKRRAHYSACPMELQYAQGCQGTQDGDGDIGTTENEHLQVRQGTQCDVGVTVEDTYAHIVRQLHGQAMPCMCPQKNDSPFQRTGAPRIAPKSQPFFEEVHGREGGEDPLLRCCGHSPLRHSKR